MKCKQSSRIDRVHPEIARRAVYATNECGKVWTQYIMIHYRATGNLAPGCDARDIYTWLEQNEAQRLQEITKR